MMGNEKSQLSGLKIEEQAIELTDFWSLYQATIKDSCRYFSLKGDGSVSVFKGDTVLGPLWTISSPLEKFSNNLLKFRHPCIIRYLSAWQQRSTMYLCTEYVQPLSHVLESHTPLQICIGLNNVLRALVFLHEKAGMSHNNVSTSCIYVTEDGQWKLGGLQYLCPFSELTTVFLKQARLHRYDKAVDPNEDSSEITTKVDQYAFAVLVNDVFKKCSNDEVPFLKEFKIYCRECLQHENPAKRPNLSDVLQHNFFNHEFISIYKFLNFLPLKSEEERSQFFSSILDNLKCFDEETIAKQLGGLLLSRLTLLDQTAKRDVIPYILKPKHERPLNEEVPGFFSLGVYKQHIKPRLMQLFAVRDSQVRKLLLAHFSKYITVFSHEELSSHILPELLLGIKDTDDELVASTLVCLSELVPILGANTVIGGKRSKFFSDGRPNAKGKQLTTNPSYKNHEENSFTRQKSLKEFSCSEDTLNEHKILNLNERPTPVGGEAIDEIDVQESIENLPMSDEEWSDWENSNRQLTILDSAHSLDEDLALNISEIIIEDDAKLVETKPQKNAEMKEKAAYLEKAALEAKRNIVDISELDIKNQTYSVKPKKTADEFDFFADMTPVIDKPQVVNVSSSESNTTGGFSKLNFVPDENLDEIEGWGDNWEE